MRDIILPPGLCWRRLKKERPSYDQVLLIDILATKGGVCLSQEDLPLGKQVSSLALLYICEGIPPELYIWEESTGYRTACLYSIERGVLKSQRQMQNLTYLKLNRIPLYLLSLRSDINIL